jgi:hypothetical protein
MGCLAAIDLPSIAFRSVDRQLVSYHLCTTQHASGPLLASDEAIRATEEEFRGQVPTQFAAQGALDGDGLEREFPDAGWNVAAAPHLQRKLIVSSAWRTAPR